MGSFPLLLKYCIKTNDVDKGKEIISFGNLQSSSQNRDNLFIQTTLIDFYGHFKDIDNAKRVFFSISESQKDHVCIGSILKVLTDHQHDEDALIIYDEFGDTSLFNDVCFVLAIKACINTNNHSKGTEIHSKL